MVGDVAAGAVASEEHGGEIRDEIAGIEPVEDVDAVIVRGRESVLGGEAVVDGDDVGRDPAGDPAAEGVKGAGEGGVHDESAAVEVDYDGEGGGPVAGIGGGGEEADLEVVGRIHDVVGGGDAIDGGGIGWSPEVDEGEDAAVERAVAADGGVGGGGDNGRGDPYLKRDGRAPPRSFRHFKDFGQPMFVRENLGI